MFTIIVGAAVALMILTVWLGGSAIDYYSGREMHTRKKVAVAVMAALIGFSIYVMTWAGMSKSPIAQGILDSVLEKKCHYEVRKD